MTPTLELHGQIKNLQSVKLSTHFSQQHTVLSLTHV